MSQPALDKANTVHSWCSLDIWTYFGDINGDGILDALCFYSGYIQYRVGYGVGDGTFSNFETHNIMDDGTVWSPCSSDS